MSALPSWSKPGAGDGGGRVFANGGPDMPTPWTASHAPSDASKHPLATQRGAAHPLPFAPSPPATARTSSTW